jgi:hypothetical protein
MKSKRRDLGRHTTLPARASRSRRRDRKIRSGYVNARQYYGTFSGLLNRQHHIGCVDLPIRILEKKMKKLATATVTALLIAATTSLAMAQGNHSQRYYNYAGSAAQSRDYNTSPASTNSGLEQQR